ncbi:MAG TPA: TonB family protein [Thermoanaerobaculia bacterium]|jgi:TonB family protein|nr:TonB family protein [Thermoanaerobaculia bacterium]
MNIPEEFGNYLLLKKLREDALGETFRAGRVGRDGIEQVVLLRVFNGLGIDGERLWQRITGRAAVQQALRSPNIGTGVDLGKVRSFPYAAYDYISGKNLATLFAQAARQRQPIPIEHALLITERMALALAAAYETRVQDERLLHGFVVPHLVMISNEGETRMLGFEAAPGLRDLWAGGWRNDDLRGYLAPEAAAAAAAAKTDDVYSLGAILFELLASERLPLPPSGGADAAAAYGQLAQLVDTLVLPNEGTPLPAPVAALLHKSLAPREQRIPDAVTWHKTISKLMIDGQFSSTTFNLAFFMHNLFRDEIDRESQEIEAEKKLELPRKLPAGGAAGASGAAGALAGGGAALAGGAAALAAGAAAGTATGPAGFADARERTGVRDAAWAAGAAGAGSSHAAAAGTAATAGSDRKPLWIGLAAAAAVAVLAVGGYLLFGRGGSAKPAAPAPANTAADAARNAAALQAQIQQMIEARSKDLESKLKGQYDDNIKQLQQKLEESRKAAAAAQEKEKEKSRSERQAGGGGGVAESPAAAAEAKPPRSERTEAASPAAASPAAGSPRAAASAAQPPSAATQREAGGSTPAPAAGNPAAAPAPAAPGAPAADAGASRGPQIQVGDLVQPGPGVSMPKIVFRPATRYPAAARRMNRAAEVAVRILVDEKGNVEKAEEVGGPVGLGFDEAAIEVAHHSTYQPATKDGVRVKMWISMKVTFVP